MQNRLIVRTFVFSALVATGFLYLQKAVVAEESPAGGEKVARLLIPKSADPGPTVLDPEKLAREVTIYRDSYGVPHIDGRSDESVVFGFAYAQAEDYFWQVEDSYILGLGRYSEVVGSRGLNSDLLNHAFEVVPEAQKAYARLPQEQQSLCRAFTSGLNFYLAKHPEVKPRLIERFEPWHVLAFHGQMSIELCYRYTRLSHSFMPRSNDRIWAATGSNGWVISGQRTQSGHAMLLANPHLPWFGFGQMYEAHLRSEEGLNFTGATFFGSPMLTLGHNEHLGWTLTTNEPDVADAWRVQFDDPNEPLNYRYDGGYRTAVEWKDTIRVKTKWGLKDKPFTFRKTHHGPIVGKEDDQTFLAARIAGLHDGLPMRQSMAMAKSRNLAEFKSALSLHQMPIMNVLYGDRAGNIFFVYNGIIPRRDPNFDWSKPVDGSDPRTEWQGIHSIDELPQVTNPPSGFLQNCNSSPFITTDEDNPLRSDFPPYMVEDAEEYKRRALRSREMLREMVDLTFDDLQTAAFDTEVYWARHEIPGYVEHWKKLKQTHPALARQVEPYVTLLAEWDCCVTVDSTAASLCEAWYETLYGTDYPGETLKPRFENNPTLALEALSTAGDSLRKMHGSWKVPYGKIHRVQRQANVADLLQVKFDDQQPSLSCVGAHGPMGVIFTQYYTPSIHIPFLMSQKKRYGLVGATYLGAYEFTPEGVRGASLVHFGESGQVSSPHYFDQARLLSEKKLKPILFNREDFIADAKRIYHPGE